MRDCERGVSWSASAAVCLEPEEGREEEEGGRGVDAGSMRGAKQSLEIKDVYWILRRIKTTAKDGCTRHS